MISLDAVRTAAQSGSWEPEGAAAPAVTLQSSRRTGPSVRIAVEFPPEALIRQRFRSRGRPPVICRAVQPVPSAYSSDSVRDSSLPQREVFW